MMNGPDPLLQSWQKTLVENPYRPAILAANGATLRTFAGIEERARDFAQKLEGLIPGQVVAVQIGNHPDWPSLFLACLRQQMVMLPLEKSITENERTAVMHACGTDAVFVLDPGRTGDNAVMLCNSAQRPMVANKSRTIPSPRPETDWRGCRPAILKLTSGTTAAPRLVRFRSKQLLADCDNICQTMEISALDLNYGVIPISHSYGFSNLLTPLIARGVAMALITDRIPRAIVAALAATNATVFPGMPVFYQSISELTDATPLPRLRLCISAGAPLAPEVARKFRARFGREIHAFYGSSECGGICYASQPQATTGFVGRAMRGVEIELLEPRSAFSRIRVRSDAVADGYFPEADVTKLGHGNFLPDDLLEQTETGYRIVGRASDLINVAGKKVNPADVEAEILKCDGVLEAVAFGRESRRRNQEVAACIVAKTGLSEAALRAHLRSRLSSWQMPRRIYFLNSIPVNERGKTSRRDLAERFAGDVCGTAESTAKGGAANSG